jgi:hypothetical protein
VPCELARCPSAGRGDRSVGEELIMQLHDFRANKQAVVHCSVLFDSIQNKTTPESS